MLLDQRVAVVVPAYREEALLGRTLARIPSYVDDVIVVDDGSPDATFEVALRCAREDARVRVRRLGYNQGVGRAIIRGYQEAMALGADAIAVMAADDQMDPSELPSVLEPILEGRAEYAKGNRLAHHEAQRMPPVRRLGTHLLGRVTGWIAGLPDLDDAQCGYTAISRRALSRLPLDSIYPRYGYPNDMLLRLGEVGARVVQPTVRPVYADEVSGLRVHKVIVPITGILARGLWRRVRPAV